MRTAPVAVLAAAVLAGCGNPVSDTAGTSTFRADGVPFQFRHPAAFLPGDVDRGNTRGEVLAVRALDKVNLLGVRRLPGGADPVPGGSGRTRTIGGRDVTLTDVRHRVLRRDVTSRIAVFAFAGTRWELECQSTPERRRTVLDACRQALTTLAPRR